MVQRTRAHALHKGNLGSVGFLSTARNDPISKSGRTSLPRTAEAQKQNKQTKYVCVCKVYSFFL